MVLEGASPKIPTSGGGDGVSAPDFTMDGGTDSELEIVDSALYHYIHYLKELQMAL